jgi:hypothetical protein
MRTNPGSEAGMDLVMLCLLGDMVTGDEYRMRGAEVL